MLDDNKQSAQMEEMLSKFKDWNDWLYRFTVWQKIYNMCMYRDLKSVSLSSVVDCLALIQNLLNDVALDDIVNIDEDVQDDKETDAIAEAERLLDQLDLLSSSDS